MTKNHLIQKIIDLNQDKYIFINRLNMWIDIKVNFHGTDEEKDPSDKE